MDSRYSKNFFCLIKVTNEAEVPYILQEISKAVPTLHMKWKVLRRRVVYFKVKVACSQYINLAFQSSWKPECLHAYLHGFQHTLYTSKKDM